MQMKCYFNFAKTRKNRLFFFFFTIFHFFLQINLVISKKSSNFAVGFGNEVNAS